MPWDVPLLNCLSLGVAGALASMGSSALNHYYDRDIDAKMPRTAKRPIPSGRVRARNVFAYGVLLCALSLILSSFTLNLVTTGMIGLGIFFYVIIYTSWLKRNNVSNIVIGGFAGSAASMAGWSVCRATSACRPGRLPARRRRSPTPGSRSISEARSTRRHGAWSARSSAARLRKRCVLRTATRSRPPTCSACRRGC